MKLKFDEVLIIRWNICIYQINNPKASKSNFFRMLLFLQLITYSPINGSENNIIYFLFYNLLYNYFIYFYLNYKWIFGKYSELIKIFIQSTPNSNWTKFNSSLQKSYWVIQKIYFLLMHSNNKILISHD